MDVGERLASVCAEVGAGWWSEGEMREVGRAVDVVSRAVAADARIATRVLQCLALHPDLDDFRERAPTVDLVRGLTVAHPFFASHAEPRQLQVVGATALLHALPTSPPVGRLMGALRAAWTREAEAEWAGLLQRLVDAGAEAWRRPHGQRPAKLASRWTKLQESIASVFVGSQARVVDDMHALLGMLDTQVEWLASQRGWEIDLLWWTRAGWSPSAGASWDEIDPDRLPFHLVHDFAQLSDPADAAISLLLRTLRDEGVTLRETRTLSEWAVWTAPMLVPAELPEPLVRLARSDATGLPATAARLDLEVDRGDETWTARAWYTQLARELLLAREPYWVPGE
jgi:hypothetical protein